MDELDLALEELAETAEDARSREVLSSLRPRVKALTERLVALGLGDLALDRRVDSLSRGERRRLDIAIQIGEGLRDAVYVLDEPCAGLHARDRGALVDRLRELAASGNAVVVVEHDLGFLRAADRVVELGPGAGPEGGVLLFDGVPDELLRCEGSSGDWMAGRRQLERKTASSPGALLRFEGVEARNLGGFDFDLRLGQLTALVGVSGSGKSSLLFEVVAASVVAGAARGCQSIDFEMQVELCRIDGSPLGRGPASSVATALGLADPLRALFARSAEAKVSGLSKAAFSALGPKGRCPSCRGSGERRVALDWLPDRVASCRDCEGSGFAAATRALRIPFADGNARSIDAVLEISASELAALLPPRSKLAKSCDDLVAVGPRAPVSKTPLRQPLRRRIESSGNPARPRR